jgi:predicted dehydrogenase
MNPIRVGILGCANIATRSLLPAFARHPAYVVQAVASRDPAKAARVAAAYGCAARGYAELTAADDVDAIYVPLPTGLHAEWVARCLRNGKHVLCEKSLASTRTEVEELVALARSARLLLVENFQFRFHSQHRHVREMLAAGAIGAVRCFRSSFGFPPFADAQNIRYSRALGGGALLDAGAYTLKAVTFMLGPAFRVQAATLWTPPGADVDISGGAYLDNGQGLPAEVAFGFDHFYQCNYEVWGSKGRLLARRAFTAPPGFPPEVILETAQGTETRTLPPDDHFANMLTHFAACLERRDFDDEYEQSLVQAALVQQVRERAYGK